MGDAGSGGLPLRTPLGLGDRAVDTSPAARRAVLGELIALWAVTLLVMRGVVALNAAGALPEVALVAVPLLFIYAPVLLCRVRGVDSYAYRLSIPRFRDWPAWRDALALTGRVSVVILVPWLVAYHLWQTVLFDFAPGHGLPRNLGVLVLHHLFFTAIPEEFFYRGYFQTRLNEVFERRYLVFGVPIGVGAILATAFFAFGHSVVRFQWWHFATFFPGLVFAWMRERTGTVTAGAFFHAACNVTVAVLDTWYGVLPR